MARYKPGPIVETMEKLVFYLERKELFFHGSSILPSAQIKNWTYYKIQERVTGGHLRVAVLNGAEL